MFFGKIVKFFNIFFKKVLIFLKICIIIVAKWGEVDNCVSFSH